MDQINHDNPNNSIRLCGTALSEMPRAFEWGDGTEQYIGTLPALKLSKEVLRYQESFFFQYLNVLNRKTIKTMGGDWIKDLRETIESNVAAILASGEFNHSFNNKEKHTDILIIYELLHHGKKKEALHFIDEFNRDWLSNDEIKFLGLLLIRHQEYDRALPFLVYTIVNNPKKEIEVLEAYIGHIKHRSIQDTKNAWETDKQNPGTSIEFFIDPKPIDSLFHAPIQCDFLDILQSYQLGFEKWTITEKEARRIYGLIADYHIWKTGDFYSANEYCKKWLECGDTDIYKISGDIAIASNDPIYAIGAYEMGFKSGDNSCLLGIAEGMKLLGESKKQESYIFKAVGLKVPQARQKLFELYCTLSSEKGEDYVAYAWEQYRFLVEKEGYIPSEEERIFVQSYNQDLLQKSVLAENTEGILSAFYSLGLYCFHTGYQVAYWQKIHTIIYSDHHHLDALTQYMEKEWGDQISSENGDGDEKEVFYQMLLSEMNLFRSFCDNRGCFEYTNYQIFWEICEYFHDEENAALYYSLYLRSNPALPRAETIYYEKFIDNRGNRTYSQGMVYKN